MSHALPTVFQRLLDAPRQGLLALVRGYRFFVRPALAASCRFEPTCSAYALEAIERHGAVAGSGLAVHRLLRCGPWCRGGVDPVPDRAPRMFSGLAARSAPPSVSTPRPPP